jgi:hypothetical protein
MSYATFLADSFAVRYRGDWLVELYPKNPAGVETVLRYSRRGTVIGPSAITIGSDTIPAHTLYRKRVEIAPTLTQSLWQSGQLLSDSLPAFGSITLNNRDGGLDQYRSAAGWTWAGCRCKVFFCDKDNVQSTIGKVYDGPMDMPSWSLTGVEIPIKSKDALFDQPLSKRVFRGTSYMLELFGDRTVSYGLPTAANITGSLTIETWVWLNALPTGASVITWGWMGGATNSSPWRVSFMSNGKISLLPTKSLVTETWTSTATLSALKFYHLAITISGRDLTFYLWDDDAQTLTTEIATNAFSSATRDATVDSTYRLRTNSDATFTPWFDEMKVWNVARTLTQIEADRFRPIPDGSIPASLVHYTRMDDGAGTTVTDSSATAANGTISGAGTSTWLWACEGDATLAGTPKPDVWGERWGVAPVLVDPIRAAYMVAGGQGGINDVTTYEGGNPHTMDATAASFRAFLTTTPSGGHSLRYLARGLFKLGANPTLPLSAYVKGYNGGALGYVNTGATITRDQITRRGPKLIDPTDLDTAAFTAYGSANPGICGFAYYRSTTIRASLDSTMAGGCGWWGYLRSSTLFYLAKFAGPSVTADYNFTQKHVIDITPLPPSKVVYECVVRYRANDVVHTAEQVAAGIKGTTAWTQWTLPYQEQRATDATIRDAFPGDASVSLTFGSQVVETGDQQGGSDPKNQASVDPCGLQYQADARALADYLLALLKGVKEGWSVTLSSTGLQLTIGQTVTLSLQLQLQIGVGTYRLGLDGTKKYVIVDVEDQQQQGTVRISVWG